MSVICAEHGWRSAYGACSTCEALYAMSRHDQYADLRAYLLPSLRDGWHGALFQQAIDYGFGNPNGSANARVFDPSAPDPRTNRSGREPELFSGLLDREHPRTFHVAYDSTRPREGEM